MMTFAHFQASRRWSEDLTLEPDLDLGFDEEAPGFLYEGGLHIFAHGASPHVFELVIGNTATVSANRDELERKLFAWGKCEGIH